MMRANNEIINQKLLTAGNFWRVLKSNKAAMISALVLILFFGAAIFARQVA